MDTPLQLSVERRHGLPVVHAVGEIDMATAPLVREVLNEVGEDKPALVVVDLTAVSFLDSSGLSVLVAARKRVDEWGGEVRLVTSNAAVDRVLEITGLLGVFRTDENLEDALRLSSGGTFPGDADGEGPPAGGSPAGGAT